MKQFAAISAENSETYCVQEYNGRLVYGTSEDVEAISRNSMLSALPVVKKSSLRAAFQSEIENRDVFIEQTTGLCQHIIDNCWKCGSNMMYGFKNYCQESSYGWPVAKFGEILKKFNHYVYNKFLATNDEDIKSSIMKSSVMGECWMSNWIRSIAVQESGLHLAICFVNDSIRIFSTKPGVRPSAFLKHPNQQNVSVMQWKPLDPTVLAVACGTSVIVWKVHLHSHQWKIHDSAECFELPSQFCPATQCLWQSPLSSALLISSPSSSRIAVIDTISSEVESVGSWIGRSIFRLLLSPDFSKLFVAFHSGCIQIYDCASWKFEEWTNFAGICTGVAWAPDSLSLILSSNDEAMIRLITFDRSSGRDGCKTFRGSDTTTPLFDLSEVPCDNTLTERIGGVVRDMELSPDGYRLVVTFKKDASVIALFIVQWTPTVILTPSGLIRGNGLGDATITFFFPKFDCGSLLGIVWSSGILQYLPLIYAHHHGSASDISRSWSFDFLGDKENVALSITSNRSDLMAGDCDLGTSE